MSENIKTQLANLLLDLTNKNTNEIYNFVKDEDNHLIIKALLNYDRELLEIAIPYSHQIDYLISKLQKVSVDIQDLLADDQYIADHITSICEVDEDGRDMIEDFEDDEYSHLSDVSFYLNEFLKNCMALPEVNYDFGFSELLKI